MAERRSGAVNPTFQSEREKIALKRERLEKLSLKELYKKHSRLTLKEIAHHYKRNRYLKGKSFPTGSFVTSVVADKESSVLDSKDKRLVLLANEKFLEIHFVPFNSSLPPKRLIDRLEIIYLGLTDASKLLNEVERQYKSNNISVIAGETTSEMAFVSQIFGFFKSEPSKRGFWAKVYNEPISFNVFTDDIPKFVADSRIKIPTLIKKAKPIFQKYGVNEKTARINAISRFSKVGSIII